MTAQRKFEPVEDEAPDVFRAIADPTRRALIDLLRDGPKPVNMLAAPFAMSRPAISKHLRILRESGLVAETQVGRERLYRLKPENLKPVDSWILTYRRFWQVQLDALKRYMETPE